MYNFQLFTFFTVIFASNFDMQLLFFVQLQIYIIRMKLRIIQYSFFQGMLKSCSAGGYLGVPLRVGLL